MGSAKHVRLSAVDGRTKGGEFSVWLRNLQLPHFFPLDFKSPDTHPMIIVILRIVISGPAVILRKGGRCIFMVYEFGGGGGQRHGLTMYE